MSFSFGTPSSAPATGLGGGFGFGANKSATPGFGLTATSQPSTGLFGTPATSAPAFGSSFGSTSAAPAFGTTSAAPAFGATSTASGFGATTASAFGATSSAPAFGATATPAFGATATPAFGTTATPAFGATNTSFGAGTALGAGGLNFGAGTNTSTAATGLSFGAPATTASTGLGGLGFGFGTAATTQSGFGLFGATSAANTSSGLFGAKPGTTTATGLQLSTTATPSLGLGGVAATSGIGAGNTTGADGKGEPPKQTKLPNEILTTVESFKEFVKKQKSLSSDVMRASAKPLHKVSVEAESCLRCALTLAGEVSRSRAISRRLRASAAPALATADTLTTHDTVDLEGTPPPPYVKDLISELEQQLITFRRQMDVADKQMQASPKLLSEQELTLGIRRMHESLVALAGRLQAVHTQVEAQKEQYLNLRKYVLKDPTDVFDTSSASTSLDQILRDAEGTRKRTKPSNVTDSYLGSAVLADPRAALSNIQQLAGPTPFTYYSSTLAPFPTSNASGQSWQPQTQPTMSLNTSGFGTGQTDSNTGFQLQKPPNKRGKQ